MPTVLPPSVIISVSATRRLPIIPVPISVTAIPLFMNDNYYLVLFKNKKKYCTAHDLKEFLLFTPCYQLLSTSIDSFNTTTMNTEESCNHCQVHIQFEGNNNRAFCIHTFVAITSILSYNLFISTRIIKKEYVEVYLPIQKNDVVNY